MPQCMIVFWDRAFRKARKVKWDHVSEDWFNKTCVLIRREEATDMHREDHMRTQREDRYKPRIETWEETNPADTFILNFQPPGLWENTFLLVQLVCCNLLWQIFLYTLTNTKYTKIFFTFILLMYLKNSWLFKATFIILHC